MKRSLTPLTVLPMGKCKPKHQPVTPLPICHPPTNRYNLQ